MKKSLNSQTQIQVIVRTKTHQIMFYTHSIKYDVNESIDNISLIFHEELKQFIVHTKRCGGFRN